MYRYIPGAMQPPPFIGYVFGITQPILIQGNVGKPVVVVAGGVIPGEASPPRSPMTAKAVSQQASKPNGGQRWGERKP